MEQPIKLLIGMVWGMFFATIVWIWVMGRTR
jgi:hypothetical protein